MGCVYALKNVTRSAHVMDLCLPLGVEIRGEDDDAGVGALLGQATQRVQPLPIGSFGLQQHDVRALVSPRPADRSSSSRCIGVIRPRFPLTFVPNHGKLTTSLLCGILPTDE